MRKVIKAIVFILIEIALIVGVSIFPQVLVTRKMGDLYSRYVFPVFSIIPNTFSNMFFMSITELIVVVGSVFALILVITIIVSIIKNFIKRGHKAGFAFLNKVVQSGLIIALCLLIVFQMMHGMNYRRTSPQMALRLTREEHTYEECCEALEWAHMGMVNARSELGEDYNGVSHLMTNLDMCTLEANSLLDSFSETYDLGMSHNYIRAKAVMLSRPWRYTGIIGVYDVFLGEANVSTDYMSSIDFPVTLCHEIAHAKGYASETDCNIIAELACIHSSRADFRYAGYYNIYVRIANTVYKYAKDLGYDLPEYFGYPPEVRRDVQADERYNDYFVRNDLSETVGEVSDSVNNAFLEANGQAGGTETYVVPTNIYVDFYFNYVR